MSGPPLPESRHNPLSISRGQCCLLDLGQDSLCQRVHRRPLVLEQLFWFYSLGSLFRQHVSYTQLFYTEWVHDAGMPDGIFFTPTSQTTAISIPRDSGLRTRQTE